MKDESWKLIKDAADTFGWETTLRDLFDRAEAAEARAETAEDTIKKLVGVLRKIEGNISWDIQAALTPDEPTRERNAREPDHIIRSGELWKCTHCRWESTVPEILRHAPDCPFAQEGAREPTDLCKWRDVAEHTMVHCDTCDQRSGARSLLAVRCPKKKRNAPSEPAQDSGGRYSTHGNLVFEGDDVLVSCSSAMMAKRIVSALQLAQEVERLREAAKIVCWFDWSDNDEDAVQAVEGLRTALRTGGG